jgi:hypothetical protein
MSAESLDTKYNIQSGTPAIIEDVSSTLMLPKEANSYATRLHSLGTYFNWGDKVFS